jgi:hypothetical protein
MRYARLCTLSALVLSIAAQGARATFTEFTANPTGNSIDWPPMWPASAER